MYNIEGGGLQNVVSGKLPIYVQNQGRVFELSYLGNCTGNSSDRCMQINRKKLDILAVPQNMELDMTMI